MRSATANEPARAARFASAALVALVAGCAPHLGALRFENREPVWRVEDRAPIPKPRELRAAHNAEEMRDARAPLLHALSVPGPVPARAVNSLGEVPDSTWFENRLGVRDLPAEAVARGPGGGRGPVPPLVVVGMKSGGHGLGVRVEDALGVGYLLKFDWLGSPEVETAIGPVVQRLLWAAGYHVPSDEVVVLPRADLIVGEGATRTLEAGAEVPMTEGDLDELLAHTAQPAGGALVRALASEILPGEPIGGYPVAGVRADDPNDRVPHEHRRDVRGQKTFFAWLGHSDAKVDNTLDVWVPREPGAELGHVQHYLVDFGLALGAKAREGERPHDSFAYDFDLGWGVASIATLGLYRRPWERVEEPPTRLGRYGAQTFDPSGFRTTRPYVPFLFADRFDAYWASKIVVRFRRAHVEAAVARGRFTDDAERARLVEAILARGRRVAREGFRAVSPVDSFRVEPGTADGPAPRICATDLWLAHRLGDDAAATRYVVSFFDFEGERVGERVDLAGRTDGTLCLEPPRLPARHDGYLMARIETRRRATGLPGVVAHFARDPASGTLRVIGVDRR